MNIKIAGTKETSVTLDGQNLVIEEITWKDGRLSYDVTLVKDQMEILLTMDESFDSFPADEDLRTLLEPENLVAAYAYQEG